MHAIYIVECLGNSRYGGEVTSTQQNLPLYSCVLKLIWLVSMTFGDIY